MKNLELLNIDDDAKIKIQEIVKMYKRFGKIYIDILDVIVDEVYVSVEQKEEVNGKMLNAKELINRAKELFKKTLPAFYKVRIRPIVKPELDKIDSRWISLRMKQYKLQPKNLVRFFNIDKSTISRDIQKDNLTRYQRVAFYYFFKNLEKKESKSPIISHSVHTPETK